MEKADKIKLLLVGLNFGQWIMQHEIQPRGKDFVEVVAVCDLDGEKAHSVAGEWGARAYTDLDEALKDDDVEAVLLITGPNGRSDLIDRILGYGKPVLTTKPFDISPAKALSVLQKAKAMGIPVMMNSPAPMTPPYIKQIMAWQKDYGLGQLTGYQASTYCSYRETPDGSWYDDPEKCPVAPIFRLGIYLINDLCYLCSPVEKVQAFGARVFTGRPTPDNAQLSLLHSDGSIGSIFASFCVEDMQYYRLSMALHFAGGTIYKNMGPMEEQERQAIRLQLSTVRDGKPFQEERWIPKDETGYPWEIFYHAVRDSRPLETVSPEQVAQSIAIIEMMRNAYES